MSGNGSGPGFSLRVSVYDGRVMIRFQQAADTLLLTLEEAVLLRRVLGDVIETLRGGIILPGGLS